MSPIRLLKNTLIKAKKKVVGVIRRPAWDSSPGGGKFRLDFHSFSTRGSTLHFPY